MYYEEEFYNNNIDNEFYENKKVSLDDIKKHDKGYRKIKERVNREINNKYYKNITVEFYLSGGIGCKIRDAVSGKYSNDLVGSKEEDLYFKAHVESTIAGPTQNSAFYLSPEEYERHHFITLPSDLKQRWYEKNYIARKTKKA